MVNSGLRKMSKKNPIRAAAMQSLPELHGAIFAFGRIMSGKSAAIMSFAQAYHDHPNRKYKVFDIWGGDRHEHLYWTLPSNKINYWNKVKRTMRLNKAGPKQYKINLLYPLTSKLLKKLPQNDFVHSKVFTIPFSDVLPEDLALITGALSNRDEALWGDILHSHKKKNIPEILWEVEKRKGTTYNVYRNSILPLCRELLLQKYDCNMNIDIKAELDDQQTISVLCLDFVDREHKLFIAGYILRKINEVVDKKRRKIILPFREASEIFKVTDLSVVPDRVKIFKSYLSQWIRMARRGTHFCLSEDTSIFANGKSQLIKDLSDNFKTISYNIKKKKCEEKETTKEFVGKKDCYKITLENGAEVIATADHRFFVDNLEERRTDLLKVGEEIYCTDDWKIKQSYNKLGNKNPAIKKSVRIKIGKATKLKWKNKDYRKRQTLSHSKNTTETWQDEKMRNNRILGIKNAYIGANGDILRKNKSILHKKWIKNHPNEFRKIIEAMNSAESIAKRIATTKKRYDTDEEYRKKIKADRNKPAYKNRIRKTLRAYMRKPGIRESVIRKSRAYYDKPGSRERIGRLTKTALSKPEVRAKMREARKLKVFPVKDTGIEVKIQDFLKQLKIEFFTHKYMNIEHGYQCDILIPSMNMIIECDGDYWHKYPIGRNIDRIRTKELKNAGFTVLRLWEREINEMNIGEFKRYVI